LAAGSQVARCLKIDSSSQSTWYNVFNVNIKEMLQYIGITVPKSDIILQNTVEFQADLLCSKVRKHKATFGNYETTTANLVQVDVQIPSKNYCPIGRLLTIESAPTITFSLDNITWDSTKWKVQ